MKAEERRTHERLLDVWQGMLDRLNRIGPTSDSHADLEAFGNVKDYILDRIEHEESLLHNARSPRPYLRRRLNSLPPGDNAADNPPTSGVENG
jgi:hypothetical protein